MKYKEHTDNKIVILTQSNTFNNTNPFIDSEHSIELHVDSCFNINILGQEATTNTTKSIYKITNFLLDRRIEITKIVGFLYYKYINSIKSRICTMSLTNGNLTTQINTENQFINNEAVIVSIAQCECPKTNIVGGGSKKKHKKTRIHKPFNRKKKTYKSKQHNRLRR